MCFNISEQNHLNIIAYLNLLLIAVLRTPSAVKGLL